MDTDSQPPPPKPTASVCIKIQVCHAETLPPRRMYTEFLGG